MYINRIWLWHLKIYLVYCGVSCFELIKKWIFQVIIYVLWWRITPFKKVGKKSSNLSSHFFINLNHSIKSMSSLLLLAKIILGQWSSKKKAWTVIISSTLNLLGRRIIINNNTTSVSSKWHKKQIWWVFFIYQYLDLEKQLRPKMTRQKWYAPREKSVSKIFY